MKLQFHIILTLKLELYVEKINPKTIIKVQFKKMGQKKVIKVQKSAIEDHHLTTH